MDGSHGGEGANEGSCHPDINYVVNELGKQGEIHGSSSSLTAARSASTRTVSFRSAAVRALTRAAATWTLIT